MKKVLLTLLAFLTVGGAWAQTTADVSGADNAIYAVGGTYVIGQDIALPIYIKNNINAQAATFYVTLQEGLEFVANSKDETAISAELSNADSDHTIMSNVANGMVALFSATNSELPEDMVVLHLKTTSGVTPGEYTITIHDLNISNADNGKEVKSDASFVSTIYLSDYLVLDENSTTAPEAMENVNVLVKRSVKANQWSTICLPFALTADQISAAFGEKTEVADFNDYELVETDKDVTGINVKFSSVTTGMVANHPYIIKATKAVTYEEGFNVEGVDVVPAAAEDLVINLGTNRKPHSIVGTFVTTKVPELCLFIVNNTFMYSTGSTNIKGFRAWFNFNDLLTEVDDEYGAKINFFVDGEATAIEGLNRQQIVEGVYDLSGRKIELEGNDLNKLQKGVYIINGKKVTIK